MPRERTSTTTIYSYNSLFDSNCYNIIPTQQHTTYPMKDDNVISKFLIIENQMSINVHNYHHLLMPASYRVVGMNNHYTQCTFTCDLPYSHTMDD